MKPLFGLLLGIVVLVSMFHPVAAQPLYPYYVPFTIEVRFHPSTWNVSGDFAVTDFGNFKNTVLILSNNNFTFRTDDVNNFSIWMEAHYSKPVAITVTVTELMAVKPLYIVSQFGTTVVLRQVMEKIAEWSWSMHGDNFTLDFNITTSSLPPTLPTPTQTTDWKSFITLIEAAAIVFESAIIACLLAERPRKLRQLPEDT